MFWLCEQVNKTKIYIKLQILCGTVTRYKPIFPLFMDVNEVSLRNFIVIFVGFALSIFNAFKCLYEG